MLGLLNASYAAYAFSLQSENWISAGGNTNPIEGATEVKKSHRTGESGQDAFAHIISFFLYASHVFEYRDQVPQLAQCSFVSLSIQAAHEPLKCFFPQTPLQVYNWPLKI